MPINVDSGSGEAFAAAVKHPIVRLALPPSKAKGPPPPHELLKASAASLLAAHGLPKELVSEVPRRWEMHGDLVMLPETAYRGAGWDGIPGAELWSSVAGTLSAKRVARKARIDAGGFRESQAVLLHGKDSEVVHVDNGIKYHYDVLLCMFSASISHSSSSSRPPFVCGPSGRDDAAAHHAQCDDNGEGRETETERGRDRDRETETERQRQGER